MFISAGSTSRELSCIVIDARDTEPLGGEPHGDPTIAATSVEDPSSFVECHQGENLGDLSICSLIGEIALMEEVIVISEQGVK